MKETATRAIIMGIIEGARALESVLSDSRRLSSLEERLDSIISIAATVSHETRILRTAMEQMEKDLDKTVIITGIVAGRATVAFVQFQFL
jgi:hypothetical protein